MSDFDISDFDKIFKGQNCSQIMQKIKVTNLVKLNALLLLSTGKRHGYELLRGLEEHMGKKLSASHIYPFLKTLEKHNLVGMKKTGKRKQYDLTPEGRKFVKDFFQKSGALLKLAIEPSVSSCAHCGCKVLRGGVDQVVKGRNLIFCCKYCSAAFSRN